VRKQAEAGIDVINDGEMSKPSYATYIKDRLAGFGGEGNTFVYQDLAAFPRLEKKVFGDPDARAARRRRATRRSRCAIPTREGRRVAPQGGARSVTAREGFLTGASPGVISLFFRNQHYRTDEEYVHAIAEAMRPEFETIARAGFVLQIDCPDLGMGRHIQYAHLSLPEWRKKAEMHVEALNQATRNIAPEQLRMHLCWGNYEGPHHCDVPLGDVIDIVFRRGRARSRSRRRTRATRTSGSCSRPSSCPKARC
jgi:5-methyltetrahydropteroyltriglutamate--homocysteine methyltransferase